MHDILCRFGFLAACVTIIQGTGAQAYVASLKITEHTAGYAIVDCPGESDFVIGINGSAIEVRGRGLIASGILYKNHFIASGRFGITTHVVDVVVTGDVATDAIHNGTLEAVSPQGRCRGVFEASATPASS